MSADTALSLCVASGVTSLLIGFLCGGIAAWVVCANVTRSMAAERRYGRSDSSESLTRTPAKPRPTGGRLIRSDQCPPPPNQ
jgi:hypothetical protein